MKNILVFFVCIFISNMVGAQNLLINNARILDGKGKVIEQGRIVVENGRIKSVTAAYKSSTDKGIDARGMTVMPGFIEAHTHLIKGAPERWMHEDASQLMQAFLDAGFTTVLSAGDPLPQVLELSRLLKENKLSGPRLIVSGFVPLTQSKGFPKGADPARLVITGKLALPTKAASVIPDERLRAMVQEHAKAGVDAIKTVIIVTPGGPEEKALSIVVDESKRHGILSITHAVSVADMIAAVKAGTHVLVHTPVFGQVDEQVASMVADSGIPMTSTLGVFIPTFAKDNALVRARTGVDNIPRFRDLDPFPREAALPGGMGAVNARLLWDAGVGIGYGTDTRFLPADALAHELKSLELFFSRQDIITMMTRHAAASIRNDEVGTLEPGKLADIVILDGDPLTDLDNLLRVKVVIKSGNVVVDKR